MNAKLGSLLRVVNNSDDSTRKLLYDGLVAALHEHLHFTDLEVVEILIATYVAHHFDSDPLWTMVIAPPASAKTELLNAFLRLDDIFPLSTLTENTLFSGFEKGQHSLIHLITGKVVIMKDFTTILELKSEKRGEVLSQLREIYDGQYVKKVGTGTGINWKGKVGLMVGVTHAIDQRTAIYQILGERFIHVRLRAVDPMTVAKKSMEAVGQEADRRSNIATLMADYCRAILRFGNNNILPDVPEGILTNLAGLASLCVKARTTVARDSYSRQIEYIPEAEAPGRLSKQLQLLAQGLARVRGRNIVTDSEFYTVQRVAFDSMNPARAMIIQLLFDRGPLTQEVVREYLRLSPSAVQRIFEDMESLALLVKEDEDGHYFFSEEAISYFQYIIRKNP